MTRGGYRTVPFRDELLADRSVHRAYADGRREWRRRGPDGVVSWRDDRGDTGTDELLGDRILKRRTAAGAVLYGRDIGYGRTAWGNGVLTVNETSLGGRGGALLAAAGAAALLPPIVDPPAFLTDAEEEELRRQAASSSGSGSSGDSDGDDDWSGWGGDDDFG